MTFISGDLITPPKAYKIVRRFAHGRAGSRQVRA